jgi:hypothetical protein
MLAGDMLAWRTVSCSFYLLVIYHCICMHLRPGKIATFFGSMWDLLCHMQAVPGIIKSWSHYIQKGVNASRLLLGKPIENGR